MIWRTRRQALAFAIYVATLVAMATAVSGWFSAKAFGAEKICPEVEAVMPILEVLGFELKHLAYDPGRTLSDGIFINKSDHRRLFVSCLDGSAELFRKAGE